MKIYIIFGISGLLLLISIIIYLSSLNSGIVYSNGFFLNASSNVFYNLPKPSSSQTSAIQYIINVKNHPNISLFTSEYTILNFVIGNGENSMLLSPYNSSYYLIKFENSSYVTPIYLDNITFYYDNGIIYFMEHSSTLEGNVYKPIKVKIDSMVGNSRFSLLSIYNSTPPRNNITFSTNMTSKTEYYQKVYLECSSDTNYIEMILNGNRVISKSNFIKINTTTNPGGFKILCYNGNNFIDYNFSNFSTSIPNLSLTYYNLNKTLLCRSNINSALYLYANDVYTNSGFGTVYSHNIDLPFTAKCEQPGNPYQKSVNITKSFT